MSFVNRIQFRNGWIYSAKKDVLVFGAPVLAGGVVTIALHYFRSVSGFTGSVYAFESSFAIGIFFHWFLTTFFDVPHVFSTFLRIGFDHEDLNERSYLYGGVILFSFLLILILATYSFRSAFRLIAYLNIFHSIKQEYGWTMYTRRRANETLQFEYRLDQLMIYNLTLLPVIWLHCQRGPDVLWLFQNDLFNVLPAMFGQVILGVYWCYIAFYFVFLGYKVTTSQASINLSKLYIFFLTWMCWYVGLVEFQGTTWMLDLSHAITYIVLIMHYCNLKWMHEIRTLRGKLFKKRKIIFLYLPLVILALIKAAIPGRNQAWVFSLVMLPAVAHYILDGLIWKFGKNNSQLSKILIAS